LGVGRVEQFVFLEQVAIAKSRVALQAPVLAGDRDRGRGRRRLRRRRPGTASAVQVFLERTQVKRFPTKRAILQMLLLLLLLVV